jgi:hypothetical protein
MLFGVAFYSFMIGIISSFFMNIDNKKTMVARKLTEIENLCEDMKINPQIADEMKKSIEYSANKIPYLWLDPEMNIYNNLPMKLKY